MFNLIPISLLVMAIGGIVYIVSNHLSEFDTNENSSDGFQFNFKALFVDWINQFPLDNVKSRSLSLTQKLLHRTRILLLKADNKLMKIIGKIAEKENGAKNSNDDAKKAPITDFWDSLSSKQQDEQIVGSVIEPEVKIDLALENETAKKFFDIKPAKISLENSKVKLTKKILKTKKYSK